MTKIKPEISVIMSVNNNFDNYLQLSQSILNQSLKILNLSLLMMK